MVDYQAYKYWSLEVAHEQEVNDFKFYGILVGFVEKTH